LVYNQPRIQTQQEVAITPEEFDRLQEHDRFMAAVQEGLADSEAGRLIDDEALAAELDAELGP
jgi:predicted transcriptional regulator